ncbi:radical SAM protein [Citreimonas sp.]|uniref:radical SAM protein n=1 Tax=Citreimonas sp. TaxID=3036715 RepID=UPI0040595F2D
MTMHEPGAERAPTRLSRYIVATEPFAEDGAGAARLIFSTRSGAIRKMSEPLWQHVAAQGGAGLAPDMLADLADTKILVPDGADERGAVLAENRAALSATDTAYHVIQPSAFCQLGCDYCGQDHTRARLDAARQDRLLTRIDRGLDARRYRALRIGWFGSEPLAGMAVIRSLTPRLQSLAAGRGVTYSAGIVTNGVKLDRRTARELAVEHGVTDAEITLDGPARHHDARRFFKTGGPSFDRIFSNIRAVAFDSGIPMRIVVRCNVDARNADGVEELIDQLADAGLAGLIDLYFAPIHDWGNDAAGAGMTPERYAEAELEWAIHAMSRGFDQGMLPPRKRITCVAMRPDSEVTDAYGNVFNCTETPYVTAYGTPNRHRIGTLETREVDRDVNRFGRFYDDVEAGQHGCARCPMLPVCGGACPKSWNEGTPACPPFKRNMPERLLLHHSREKLLARHTAEARAQI